MPQDLENQKNICGHCCWVGMLSALSKDQGKDKVHQIARMPEDHMATS